MNLNKPSSSNLRDVMIDPNTTKKDLIQAINLSSPGSNIAQPQATGNYLRVVDIDSNGTKHVNLVDPSTGQIIDERVKPTPESQSQTQELNSLIDERANKITAPDTNPNNPQNTNIISFKDLKPEVKAEVKPIENGHAGGGYIVEMTIPYGDNKSYKKRIRMQGNNLPPADMIKTYMETSYNEAIIEGNLPDTASKWIDTKNGDLIQGPIKVLDVQNFNASALVDGRPDNGYWRSGDLTDLAFHQSKAQYTGFDFDGNPSSKNKISETIFEVAKQKAEAGDNTWNDYIKNNFKEPGNPIAIEQGINLHRDPLASGGPLSIKEFLGDDGQVIREETLEIDTGQNQTIGNANKRLNKTELEEQPTENEVVLKFQISGENFQISIQGNTNLETNQKVKSIIESRIEGILSKLPKDLPREDVIKKVQDELNIIIAEEFNK